MTDKSKDQIERLKRRLEDPAFQAVMRRLADTEDEDTEDEDTEGDIPANWRDDPAEYTPPIYRDRPKK